MNREGDKVITYRGYKREIEGFFFVLAGQDLTEILFFGMVAEVTDLKKAKKCVSRIR